MDYYDENELLCDHGCPVVEDCEACNLLLEQWLDEFAEDKAAMRDELTRLDAWEDMQNRRLLGMPEVDFDTGEPCECDYCYARGTLDVETAKYIRTPLKVITFHSNIARSRHGPIPGL